MKGTERVKLEFRNPRYPDRELKEHLLELIHYSRYAGINLESFRKAISKAILVSGPEGRELKHGGGLIVETDYKTSNLVRQLVQMYPVFSTWDIKGSKAKKSATKKKTSKKETTMAAKKKAKKKAAKKKPAKKKAAKKKPAKKKAKKKAAKKKPAKKKAAKKKPAKKKAAKKKPAKKKAKKKAAKKKKR